jgi:hypothetical protein
LLILGLACLAATGCGRNANSAFGTVGTSIGAGTGAGAPVQVADAKKGDDEAANVKGKEPVIASRKIIYTTDLRLSVENFGAASEGLEKLVETIDGAFVARSEVGGASGSSRAGQWTIRVPVEERQQLVAELLKLGELQRGKRDSKDVTEEYFDVESRIKNKKVEEERLLEHLKRSTAKLEEILAVEREISRVRGEIEQAQGRLNLLANLTALATVTVHIAERVEYVPETTAGFGTTIARTFSGSVNSIVAVGKEITLMVVAVVPWFVTLAVFLGLPLWLWRWWGRKLRPANSAIGVPTP